ncbi:hypothetical protein EG68_06679 [Paragonimus skrjabini miyazakii]|uniref:Uncharacterized protein n=1 Tax=Paragonimus skrjabini miyazakii TaxID=59628 RepID=A0A8S9YPN2_9TREM|nr:hypothetical protein EG68_06679 [Paragonimus skrjabini miyazakii]
MNTSFFTQDEKGFPKTNVFDDVSPISTHLKCNKFLSRGGGNIKDNLEVCVVSPVIWNRNHRFGTDPFQSVYLIYLRTLVCMNVIWNDFEFLRDRLTNLRNGFFKLKNILNPDHTGDVNRTIETLFDVRNQLHELSNVLGVVQPVQLKQPETDSVTPPIRRRSPRLIEKDKNCHLENLETKKPTEKGDLRDKPKFKGSLVSMLDFLTAQEVYLENHQKALINTTEDLMKIQTEQMPAQNIIAYSYSMYIRFTCSLIEFSKNEMNVNYSTLVREVRDETIKFFTKCLQDKLEIMFCEP